MMVARHEMPGKGPDMIRPVGNGVIGGAMLCSPSKTIAPLANRSYRALTGRASGCHVPGISCLATII